MPTRANGIDDYRNYAILDSEGASNGSNPNVSVTRTSNVMSQWQERPERARRSDSIMDIAVPRKNGDGAVDYIVYIADNKRGFRLSWRFFQIVMQAMMFGLLAAILLSFLLKTITTDRAHHRGRGRSRKATLIRTSVCSRRMRSAS
ncbi:MAG: hypothetical protein ACLRIO_07860 [Butyricicoccus sp.]